MISVEHWGELYAQIKASCVPYESEMSDFFILLRNINQLISHHSGSENKKQDCREIVLLEEQAWELCKQKDNLWNNASKELIKLFEEIHQDEFMILTAESRKALFKAIDENDPAEAKEILLSEVGVIWRKEFCQLLYSYKITSDKDNRAAILTINVLQYVDFDFNNYTFWGETALCAVAGGRGNEDKIQLANAEVIQMLLKAGADINKLSENNLDSALKLAILSYKSTVVNFLLSNGAKPYPQIMEDVIVHLNYVYFLKKINDLFDIDWGNGSLPYFYGINRDKGCIIDQEVFNYCLSKGMGLEHYSLWDEVVLNSPEAVRQCLRRGDKLDQPIDIIRYHPCNFYDGKPFLVHHATMIANKESLVALIESGLEINKQDSFGRNSLHYAAASYFHDARTLEILKMLIFAGVEINKKDNYGKTPLHYAAELMNNHICKILIYAGADISIKNIYDKTAFDYGNKKGDRKSLYSTKARGDFLLPRNKCHSLLMWSAYCVVNSNDMINLAYRKKTTKDVSLLIEKIADMKFTP